MRPQSLKCRVFTTVLEAIGGKEKKQGWSILNIQKKDVEKVDFVGDITDLSQFDDNSVEEIYASHVIEHVNQKNIEIIQYNKFKDCNIFKK